MTKEYLDKMGYDYRFGSTKPTKNGLEEIKRWHKWGNFIGCFLIGCNWYIVFDK